jgi:hypothetical protein
MWRKVHSSPFTYYDERPHIFITRLQQIMEQFLEKVAATVYALEHTTINSLSLPHYRLYSIAACSRSNSFLR